MQYVNIQKIYELTTTHGEVIYREEATGNVMCTVCSTVGLETGRMILDCGQFFKAENK